MQHIPKPSIPIILFLIILFCCCCSLFSCCLSIITGGVGDWYMSECLATNDASEDETNICYSKKEEETCEQSTNCWWRHSIITMMIGAISGGTD